MEMDVEAYMVSACATVLALDLHWMLLSCLGLASWICFLAHPSGTQMNTKLAGLFTMGQPIVDGHHENYHTIIPIDKLSLDDGSQSICLDLITMLGYPTHIALIP